MNSPKHNRTARSAQIEEFPRSSPQLQHDQPSQAGEQARDQPAPTSLDAPTYIDIQDQVIRSGIRQQVVRLCGSLVDTVLMELTRRAHRDPASPKYRSCRPAQQRIAADIGRPKSRTGVNDAIRQLTAHSIIKTWKTAVPGKQGMHTHYRIADKDDLEAIAHRLEKMPKVTRRPFPNKEEEKASRIMSDGSDIKANKIASDESDIKASKIVSGRSDIKPDIVSDLPDTGKISKNKDGWMEDIDPSIQGLRAEEVALSRRMLTHPHIGISRAKADEIAVVYDALTVFAQCCRYINDHTQGVVKGPGALINHFDNPDKWPTPEITETAGSNFYYRYWQEVRNLDEIDATDEPATAHSDALNASSPTDEAQIDPDPDTQPVQTPSETPDEQRPEVNGSNYSTDLWRQVKHDLQQQLAETTFETWVRDTEPIDYTAGAFIVGAPHRPARDWLTARLLQKAKSVLERLTGQQVNLLFVDRNDLQYRPALAKRTEAAVGGSDDGQVNTAPDTTDTSGPPTAEQKAPDEPDYLRQAQDAERELKQARIKHAQRRRRDHRRHQSILTSLSKYSSHRQNGTASPPVRDP